MIAAIAGCVWSGDAAAATPPPDTCYDVGFGCFNAGPESDEAGICVASTCYDLLDASFACGVCEFADAGHAVLDAGSPDGKVDDASPSDVDSGSGSSTSDAATSSDDAESDAEPADDGSSVMGSPSGSGSPPDGSTGSSSSGDAPEAGAGAEATMPGCAITPRMPSAPTGLVLTLALAALAGLRRRRN
jgi:MYXO-CTERM domain-containing protein